MVVTGWEPSVDIRVRIAKAREAQRQRSAGATGGAKGNLLLTGKPLPEA